jgi:hypothetical protein
MIIVKLSFVISADEDGWVQAADGFDCLFRMGRLELFQPDFNRDIIELLAADSVELFAAGLKPFIDLDGLLGHCFVGFLRSAQEREILASCNALVSVGIQAQAEDRGRAFLFGLVQH